MAQSICSTCSQVITRWSDTQSANGIADVSTWARRSLTDDLAKEVEPHSIVAKETNNLADLKALWDGSERSTTPGASATFAGTMEQSTDDGSEHKGSESDSMPESYEGFYDVKLSHPQHNSQQLTPLQLLQHQQQPHLRANVPDLAPMLRYFPPTTANLCPLAPTAATSHADASAMYSSYMEQDEFLGPQSFATASSSFAYEAIAANFQAPVAATDSPVAGVDGAVINDVCGCSGVPSIGSYAHLSGQCSRCCFYPKGRCANGYSCQFCHFDHDKRPRNGKKKRYRRSPDDTGEAFFDD